MGVNTCLWSELEHKKRTGKGCSKNVYAKCFACELWIKRVDTFGVALYRNQWPVIFIVYFAELHIGSSIRYENTFLWKLCSQIVYSQKNFNNLQLFFWEYFKHWKQFNPLPHNVAILRFCKQSRPRSGSSCKCCLIKSCLMSFYSVCPKKYDIWSHTSWHGK